VLGVAFDLGGTPVAAFDQQAARDAAKGHRGGVKARDAGNLLLGLAGVGQDVLLGAAAGGEARHRHRGAHDFHKGASRRCGGRVAGSFHKLVFAALLEVFVPAPVGEATPDLAAPLLSVALRRRVRLRLVGVERVEFDHAGG